MDGTGLRLPTLEHSGEYPDTARSEAEKARFLLAHLRDHPSDHRDQRVDNRRKSARLPLYLAAGRVLSNPPIIVVPQRSQTRHSHLVGLRSVINTSNTAQSHPQLHVIKIRFRGHR
jgi:hypothetical protein